MSSSARTPFRVIVATATLVLIAFSVTGGCSSESDEIGIPDLSIAQQPTNTNANGEPEREAELKLTLGVGARFPLKKTIAQTLVQKSKHGNITSTSNLALTFAIAIEREDEGRRLLNVNYQRVQYSHELLGERVSFDSVNPPEQVPESFQVYKGLVGNGFKFWLGARNRIAEVEGFDEFLKRCVRFAPENRQKVLLEHIVSTQKDEGFSNFVDDSIGLLPYKVGATGKESLVKEGEKWTKRRQIMRPLPMSIHTTYTVSELRDDIARIEIFGTIFPVKSTDSNQAENKEIITLEQGHAIGSCVIDLKTGLPLHSKVDRLLDMIVQVPGQAPYKQHKTITTTIESFPNSPKAIYSKADELPLNSDQIRQTSGEENDDLDRQPEKAPRKIDTAEFELESASE
jgi:hypothetical protein